MAKTLRNTAKLLGEEIELETYVPDNKAYKISTITTSGLVENTLGWRYWPKDEEDPEDEAFYAFDHNNGTKTYAKGRNKMEDLKTAFAKLPLSAFTLTDLQPSLQLKKYITLSDRVVQRLGGKKFLRPASIKAFEGELNDRHGGNFKKGHMSIVQKVPLLVLFLFSNENREVLHPFIKEIIEKMEVEMETLVTNLNIEKEEKLKLTEKGRTYFYELVEKFFLKCLKENSFQLERRHYKTERTDAVLAAEALRPRYLFRRAYEHLCWTQETHFKQMTDAFWMPFTFQWEGTGNLPHTMELTQQSLSNLSLEEIGGRIECNACRDGATQTFYGRHGDGFVSTAWAQRPFGDDNWKLKPRGKNRNHTGVCVRILKDLLKELGVTEADKNNSLLQKFIGTWEQAEERIRIFKEQQRKIRDTPQYDMIQYYSTLIRLQIDYHLKFFAGISRQGSNLDEKGFKDAFTDYYSEFWGEYKKGWGKAGRKVWNGLTGLIWSIGSKLFRYGPVILYKVFSLILESPIMREWMLQSFESWVDEVCMGWSVQKSKQEVVDGDLVTVQGADILRQKNGSLERFFKDEGRWWKVNKKEREKIAKETNEALYRKLRQRGAKLMEVMADYMSAGKFKNKVETLAAVNSVAMTGFLDLLQNIPYIGWVFKSIGTEKIQNVISGYAVVNGNRIFSEIFQRNMKQINALLRFTLSTMQLVSCSFPWNTSVIRYDVDGDKMGTLKLFYKQYRNSFAGAFTNIMYNLPYYALLILCEEEANKKKNKQTRAYWVEQLIRSVVVGTSHKNQTTVNKNSRNISQGRTKAMTLEDRFEDNPSMEKTVRERRDRLQKLKDRRDEVERWEQSVEIYKFVEGKRIPNPELKRAKRQLKELDGKINKTEERLDMTVEEVITIELEEEKAKNRKGVRKKSYLSSEEYKTRREKIRKMKERLKRLRGEGFTRASTRASASDTSPIVIKGVAMIIAAWLSVLAAEAVIKFATEEGVKAVFEVTTEAATQAFSSLKNALSMVFANGKSGAMAFLESIKGKASEGRKWLQILIQYFKEGATQDSLLEGYKWTGRFAGFAKLTKSVKDTVGWKGAALLYISSYMTFKSAKNWVKDTLFAPKLFPLQTVLQEKPMHSSVFYVMIKKYMYQFQGKGWGLVKDSYDKQKRKEQKYVNVKSLVASKESVIIDWPERHEFLDLEEVSKFFVGYRQAENLL
jgi:hypothetical protein